MNRKCAIFCGSSFDPSKKYLNRILDLIPELSSRFDIIYGGSNTGYMQAVAQKVIDSKGYLIGIMPKFLQSKELRFEGCHQWIETETMHQRIQTIVDQADCFIGLPGGVGTYEEIIDILSWTHIGLVNKPLVLYNLDNFFDGLVQQINQGIKDGFILESLRHSFLVSDNIEQIIEYLNDFDQEDELWDVMDKERKVTAKVIKRRDYQLLKENEYHLVVFIIFRQNRKVLFEKRSPHKKLEPSKWGLTGGSVRKNETSKDAIIREVNEELGLDLSQKPIRLAHQSTIGNTHYDYYELDDDDYDVQDFKLNPLEVVEVKYLSYQQVLKLIDNNELSILINSLSMLFPWSHIV